MPKKKGSFALPLEKEEIIKDYRLAYQSRQASLIGRREVLSGKAKFGIFGDGKEIANIAIARAFQKGDWRSGYYRDQTWMFMLGVMNIQEFFAQLYAHADLNHESNTGGRSMNSHFASRYINPDGSWKNQTEMYNTAADVSPTGAQMPRTVGLAYASVVYRGFRRTQTIQFSKNGNEIAFASIGNASTSEGMFWESVNAIGVLQSARHHHHLRRRLRHLRSQSISNGQGKYWRDPAGVSSAMPNLCARRSQTRIRPLHCPRLGLSRARRNLSLRRRDRARISHPVVGACH